MKSLYLKDGDAPVERLKTSLTSMSEVGVADMSVVNESLSGIVWTDSMRRMYTLVERCWR